MGTRSVIIVGYDPQWPAMYEEEKAHIMAAIGGNIVAIEHVGSTSVPGLAAKPIIDIMVGVRRLDDALLCIEPLQPLGYEYRPQDQLVMPERRYFRKNSNGVRTHHLHMVEPTSNFWRDHILFRDYLRAHPASAAEYARVKRALAAGHPQDTLAYTEAKTPFITSLLAHTQTEK